MTDSGVPGSSTAFDPGAVAVVDDHDLALDGLVAAVGLALPEAGLAYRGPSVEEAARVRPAVALLDVGLGGTAQGVASTVSELRGAGALVLLVSAHGSAGLVRAGIAARASAFLSKSAVAPDLAAAVSAARAGRVFVGRDLASIVLADPGGADLDPDDLATLRLIAAGLSAASVARRLGLTTTEVAERVGAATARWAAAAPTVD